MLHDLHRTIIIACPRLLLPIPGNFISKLAAALRYALSSEETKSLRTQASHRIECIGKAFVREESDGPFGTEHNHKHKHHARDFRQHPIGLESFLHAYPT
ncbi:hypothetical protein XPA_005380 [Xanthoria parietina]